MDKKIILNNRVTIFEVMVELKNEFNNTALDF